MAEKRKRGKTHNKKARAKDDTERKIKFKPDGTPTGKSKSEFTNYVAYCARDRVPCNITSWDKVSKDLKDLLWEETKVKKLDYTCSKFSCMFIYCSLTDFSLVILQSFWNISDDTHKDKMKKYMGERWKAWKTRLRKDYIREADPDNPRYPWQDGHHVNEKQWAEFVAYTNNTDFKVYTHLL